MNIVNLADIGIVEYADTRNNFEDGIEHGLVLSEIYGWDNSSDISRPRPKYRNIGLLRGLSYLKAELSDKDIPASSKKEMEIERGEKLGVGYWKAAPIVIRKRGDDENISDIVDNDYKAKYYKNVDMKNKDGSQLFKETTKSVGWRKVKTKKKISKQFPAIPTAGTGAEAPFEQPMIMVDNNTLAQVGPILTSNKPKSSMQVMDDKGDVGFMRDIIFTGTPGFYARGGKAKQYSGKNQEIKQNDDDLNTAFVFGEPPDGYGYGLTYFGPGRWAFLAKGGTPLSSEEKVSRRNLTAQREAANKESRDTANSLQKEQGKYTKNKVQINILKKRQDDVSEKLKRIKEKLDPIEKKNAKPNMSPITFADGCIDNRHRLKGGLHYAHITTEALFYKDSSHDGEVDFKNKFFVNGGRGGKVKEADIRFDKNTSRWKINYWDKFSSPTTAPGDDFGKRKNPGKTGLIPPWVHPPETEEPGDPWRDPWPGDRGKGTNTGVGNPPALPGGDNYPSNPDLPKPPAWNDDTGNNGEKPQGNPNPFGGVGVAPVPGSQEWWDKENEKHTRGLIRESKRRRRKTPSDLINTDEGEINGDDNIKANPGYGDEHATVTPNIAFEDLPHGDYQASFRVDENRKHGKRPQTLTQTVSVSTSRDLALANEKVETINSPNDVTQVVRVGKGAETKASGRADETQNETATPSLEILGTDPWNNPSSTDITQNGPHNGGLSQDNLRIDNRTISGVDTSSSLLNNPQAIRSLRKGKVETLKNNGYTYYVDTTQGFTFLNDEGKLDIEPDSLTSVNVPKTTGVVWHAPYTCKANDTDRMSETGYDVVQLYHKTRMTLGWGLPTEAIGSWSNISYNTGASGLHVDLVSIDRSKLQTVATGIAPVGLADGDLYLEQSDNYGGTARGYHIKVYKP